ncbi:hypothetical protein Tco_1331749, partial [Tanacetum coccineum]
SDDEEVINELNEYGNAWNFHRTRIINIIDGNDLAFPCMIEGLESTGRNLVAIVRDVYVFVGSFTYVTDFVVLEDIGEFIVSDIANVVLGRPFRAVPPILELSQRDLMNGLRYSHEKNKLMYKNSLNLGTEYQVDEDMKEWIIRGHVIFDEKKLWSS